MEKVKEEVRRVERIVEEHFQSLAVCLENQLRIHDTLLTLNQKLVNSHRQCKGIIQFMQTGDSELEHLESEIERIRNYPFGKGFAVVEAQATIKLTRDDPHATESIRRKLKAVSREAVELADRLS